MGEAALMAQGREFRGLKLDSGGRVVRDITPGRPGRIDPSDADIVWRFDMVKELNTKPYNSLTSAALVVGDYLFVGTGNTGTLSASRGGPKPTPIDPSPALIVLDKRTGKLLAVDDAGIHRVIFHGAHASPAYGVVNGRPLVFYGAAGRCYAFDARFQPRADGQPAKLKPAWEFNCLASGSYADPKAPRPKRAEVVATPVFHKNRVYMAIGNDLIHSGARAGPGRLVCIDATQQGDISATGLIWSLDTIRSSSSTVAIKDGLVYAADASGMVYCLDADTGRVHWTHPTGPIWASPLIADGKVYLPTHDRGLLVLAEGRTKRIITDAQGTLVLDASAVAANGVLYIASHKNLYALKAPGSGK
jgi:outer membrane protein assembly factor BamB